MGRFRGIAAVAAACAVLTVPACEAPPGAGAGDRARLAAMAGRPDAPEAAVTHLGWRDDSARSDQYADYARSHGGFYGKYLRRGDAFIAARAVVHWMRAFRRWTVGALSGDRERARFARAYVLGLPSGIRAGWRSAAPRRA